MARHRRRPMSEINVVPYIDVMLVLLVIFMVTAPMMTQGIKVDLPQVTDAEPTPESVAPPLVVTVRRDGSFALEQGLDRVADGVDSGTLLQRLQQLRQQHPSAPVYLNGDAEARYAAVAQALDQLVRAGIAGVGLLTQPATNRE